MLPMKNLRHTEFSCTQIKIHANTRKIPKRCSLRLLGKQLPLPEFPKLPDPILQKAIGIAKE